MAIDPSDPTQYELMIRRENKTIFSMATDGTIYADLVGIRDAAAEPIQADYAIICRALVWALDRNT